MAAGKGRIAAIVLAAGSSKRFGPENKLLADAGGKPLLLRAVGPLIALGLVPVIVVTGHERTKVVTALDGIPVRLVHNKRHLEGMGGSVAIGAAAVGDDALGALITPGDTPNLSVTLVETLLTAFRSAGGEKIVFPVTSAGEQRNPVVWPARFLPELMRLSGEIGAKSLIAKHPSETRPVAVVDESSFIDIDRVEDLERWRQVSRPERSRG